MNDRHATGGTGELGHDQQSPLTWIDEWLLIIGALRQVGC